MKYFDYPDTPMYDVDEPVMEQFEPPQLEEPPFQAPPAEEDVKSEQLEGPPLQPPPAEEDVESDFGWTDEEWAKAFDETFANLIQLPNGDWAIMKDDPQPITDDCRPDLAMGYETDPGEEYAPNPWESEEGSPYSSPPHGYYSEDGYEDPSSPSYRSWRSPDRFWSLFKDF